MEELGEEFFEHPSYIPDEPIKEELLTRIIFSALIDADRESAARFLEDWEEVERPPLETLLNRFESNYKDLTKGAPDTPANTVRREIYQCCKIAADLDLGFFRLTTPTGGGKTLSVMAFALRHAIRLEKKRVIYGPPFTSIIEQSAQVYRDYLGEDAVLEHHSGVIIDDDMEELERYQLSAQRWHFPVIVSTTVQLFESLFSRKPSQCRKVHRITNSVIVLDEVQALPTKYLSPIMAMLRGLVEDWGCSVVFCSATQPWYGILNLPEIRDLVPKDKRQRHFEILNKRVDYCYQSQFWDWSNLVTDIRERSLTNALVVVNTKADARKGFEVLSELGNTFHLSTNMYAVHRRQVLAEVRDRLKKRLPVYLVSTQLIEAGVDVDFAAGYRVITGLDSIVQTAGRVNRNGKRNNATLTIFDLKGGGYPSEEEVKDKTKITRYQLKTGESLYSEPICENYFKSFLASPEVDLDEQNIQELRNTLVLLGFW